MKAAVYHGPNQPLKIEEWPTPTINTHEVLVKRRLKKLGESKSVLSA